MHPPQPPSPELFFDTMQAYQRTAALRTAIELDVFTAVEEGAHDAAAIAQRCDASVRGIRILCDFLTIMGFLTKQHEAYALTPDTAMFLSRRSPACLGGTMEFLAAPQIVRHFDDLTSTVRRGSIAKEDSTVADENPVWQKFARAMMPMMMPAAQAMADILGIESAGPVKILDVAAGHGVFGITLARRNEVAEVVAVDWAGVLEVAKENAARMGVAARHRGVAGDAFAVDWGEDYDIALITNFLHHFDAPTCTTLLRKVAASLAPGGRIAVLEFVPNDDRVSPPAAASFAMQMLGNTPHGDAYTFRELAQMLAAAGFSGVRSHPLPGPHTVVIAER